MSEENSEFMNTVEGYQPQSMKEDQMSETTTKNFFENPNQGNGSTGWAAAGGALVGSLVGENGLLGGGKNQSVTPDQLGVAINGLRSSMNTDSLESHLDRIGDKIGSTTADSTIALGAGIAGVKDAIANGNSQSALALCNLGHNMQAGFASVNQTVLATAAQGRELALQQALDAERARNTVLAVQVERQHNDANHAMISFKLDQVIAAGKA